MALLTTSNSLCAVNLTERAFPGSSSRAPNFSSPDSASSSTTYAAGSEYSLRWKGGGHWFSPGMWPSSLQERRKRRCTVRVNSSSSPDSQTTETNVDFSSTQGPAVQSHLELLNQITSESALGTAGSNKTIAQQLAEDRELEGGEEVTIPLGSGKLDIKATDLTISQKRNIARQNYMNKVAERNDAPFFTTVALFVLVPPVAILGVAVATGYVDLFP